MRRAPFILGLALPAVAVAALVAFASGVGSDQPSSTDKPRRGEANQAPHTSSVDTELNESTEVVPLPLDGGQENDDWNATGLADEETSRKMVRESATRRISKWYSLLLEDLDLTPREKDALLSLLIEDRMASTWTDYKRGETIDKEEQSRRIAAIIGDPKLQQFRALERDLPAYREVEKVRSMLQQYDVPLADSERDRLLKILVEVGDQYETPPPSDAKLSSIEELEHILAQRDEFERHVMELAPSVLSPEQATYLFEQYQYLSYERARALERQKERAAATGEDSPWSYPIWSD